MTPEDDFMDWEIPEDKEEEIHICENEGCSHKGFACYLPGDYNEETKEFQEDSIEYLCCEHAEEQGYCMGCGTFIAGTGMEFRNNGYCDNCWDEIRASEFDDEEDFPDGSLDY
jgi:hypothetical protein